jgi:hypothetical protein
MYSISANWQQSKRICRGFEKNLEIDTGIVWSPRNVFFHGSNVPNPRQRREAGMEYWQNFVLCRQQDLKFAAEVLSATRNALWNFAARIFLLGKQQGNELSHGLI